MNRFYPSDISLKQFNEIKPLIESIRKKTRPRTVNLYDIFCGVLYVLKSGCQWRMLPKDYPKWELCYYYFSLWNKKYDPSNTRDGYKISSISTPDVKFNLLEVVRQVF